MTVKPPAPLPGLAVREDRPVPPQDGEVTRRTALKMLSATALLSGAACTRKPERKIVSLAERPEYERPGVPLHYATSYLEGAWPYGLLVKCVDGRPIKVEGLPDHPLNRGTSSAAMQATLLSLYDPERLRSPRAGGADVTWAAADEKVVAALRAAASGVVITRSLLGPSERALLGRLREVKGGLTHLVWETADDAPRRGAWKALYGTAGVVLPDLSKARIVLSLDCDFLGTDGEVLGATRDFVARRRVDGNPRAEGMNRLYVVESAMTVTGSNADHRIPLRPSGLPAFLDALEGALAGGSGGAPEGVDARVFAALADDLRQHQGGAVVVLAGGHLPASVHARVASLNETLGASGKTLRWIPEPAALPATDVAEVVKALSAGPDVVVLLGVNPVYDGGRPVAEALARAKTVVAHGLTLDETLDRAAISLPSAHPLECWNDAAPLPGVVALGQPLIAPLFGGRQEAESLLLWAKALAPQDPLWRDAKDWHDFVKSRWMKDVLAGAPSATAWDDALRRGFVGQPQDAAFPSLDPAKAKTLAAEGRAALEAGREGHDVVLLPGAGVQDGRHAGNVWLQEMPDPVSRLVWDNAASLSPATASALGVREQDRVAVRVGDRSVEVPVLVQPGVAPGVLVLTLGHGRTKGAGAGEGVGVNVAPLLGGGPAPRLHVGAKVAKVAGTHHLVRTQKTFDMDGRPIVLDAARDEYVRNTAFVKDRVHVPPLDQMHDEFDYSKGFKWEMAIDLSLCTGCTACVIACQSENNIPVVGKEEVSNGREMHWISIDRYEVGDPANPKVLQQPMLCQHCDNAPCESVCPVNATSHSPEGLNEQTYNRCVGTRYCSNNCPYKVRRFNFLNYTGQFTTDPVHDLLMNPQVTVRSRGVMEKCTFCVQRITAAKFAASNAGVPVPDGAVKTACQQACPAGAIVFGDRNTPGSQVAKKSASPLAYHVLEELNVRPNVAYLARVRNPHPSLAQATSAGGHR